MADCEEVRLPPRMHYGEERLSSVEHLIQNGQHVVEFAELLSDTTSERLFGYVLPPFQRPPAWSREQQARFVESLWLHLPVGHYVVNMPDVYVGGKTHRTDGWLIDGQQRLRAIKAFLDDEFPLFGLRWSEFNQSEVRAFRLLSFPHFVVKSTDEAELRELYNKLAFGGTPHDSSQRV